LRFQGLSAMLQTSGTLFQDGFNGRVLAPPEERFFLSER
jgi:hypothetical protein